MKIIAVSASSVSKADLFVAFASSTQKTNAKSTEKAPENLVELSSKLPATWDKKNILERLPKNFTADDGQNVFLRGDKTQPHILLIGIGRVKKQTAEQARRLSATILKCAKQEDLKNIRIFSPTSLSPQDATVGFCEGLLLANYKFVTFKAKDPKEMTVDNVEIAVDKFSATLNKTIEASTLIAEATNFARWLGDCPGNFMTPTQLAEETQKAAKGTALKVTVWDKKRIEKEKMGSFLGVARGSSQEPRFIIMEYKGGPAKQKPICFVGKGLTFDSGGISIKPSAAMEEMKFDMCGGASVIATLTAIAKLKLKINAIGLVPATENMPGPSAVKPGDIETARNGKTIEINNTDAEGRLILADALVYASEQKPGMILDAATLTGAMMIALGNTHTGFFTRNESLSKKVYSAAESCGESVWHMPLTDDHAKDMKGYYADLTNLAPSRNAGSATAAAFLESFVEKDIPWAHFDIAGTAWNVSGRLPYITTKGASGAIVRTFIEMAKSYK